MNKIKLVSAIISFLFFISISAFSVFADEEQSEFPYAFNQETVVQEAVSFINSTFSDEIEIPVVSDDIDLSKAYKIFTDTDVFSLESDNYDAVLSELGQGSYIYEIPVSVGLDTYIISVEKVKPLTEDVMDKLTDEMIAEQIAKVGEWHVYGVSQRLSSEFPFIDYYEIISECSTISYTKTPLLVHSQRYFGVTVGLVPDEENVIKEVIPTFFPEYLESNIPTGMNNLNQNESANFAFDYTATKNAINALPTDSNTLAGAPSGVLDEDDRGSQPKSMFVTAVIIILILSLIVIMFLNRRNRTDS
jgi:hypothetical protein